MCGYYLPATACVRFFEWTVPRPSEVFQSAVEPALARAGVAADTARARWPVHVLRDVLKQLEAATPDSLLERELWAASIDAPTFWQRRQRCAPPPGAIMVGQGRDEAVSTTHQRVTCHRSLACG